MRLPLLVAASVLFLAACGGDGEEGSADTATGAGASNEPIAIKIGSVPVAQLAPLYLGIEEGFFADEGLDATVVAGQGGSAIIAGVVSGELDFGVTDPIPMIQAQEQRIDVTAVAPASATSADEDYAPSGAIIVKGDSGIQDVGGLNSTTVGVLTLKSGDQLKASAAIDAGGGDSSSIKFVELPVTAMTSALNNGRADAVVAQEPFLTQALEGGAKILSRYNDEVLGYKTPNIVWVTNRETAENDPELVKRFQAAIEKSNQYVQDNLDETREFIPTFTDVDPAIAREMGLGYWGSDLTPLPDVFQKVADLMLEYEYIKEEPDLAALSVDGS